MVFSEDSRVKLPCILHLVRLGYRYLSLKDADRDEETNIFPAHFHAAIARINPGIEAHDIDRLLADVKLLLDNEDLGKAFYERIAQVPTGVTCGIGRNITAVRPRDIHPNFFYLSLSGQDVQKQILANLDQGAFFKSFNVKGIKVLNLLRPACDLERSFEEKLTLLVEKRHGLAAENSVLKQLRDWLLPMLMNGQVTVA